MILREAACVVSCQGAKMGVWAGVHPQGESPECTSKCRQPWVSQVSTPSLWLMEPGE